MHELPEILVIKTVQFGNISLSERPQASAANLGCAAIPVVPGQEEI
jgi:hypothetical protein